MEISRLLNQSYTCDCGQSFTTKRALTRHNKSVHGPIVDCHLCGKKLKCFRRRDLQLRHILHGCLGFKKNCNKTTNQRDLIMELLPIAFSTA